MFVSGFFCTRTRGKLFAQRDEAEMGTAWQVPSHIPSTPIPISARLDWSPRKEVLGQSMRRTCSEPRGHSHTGGTILITLHS